MTTRKPVGQSTADPAKFDIDGFLTGFKPALVSAKLHHRGDLIPVMADLLSRVEAIRSTEKPDLERSFADTDPLAELTTEYNRVQAEFEAGGYELFEFRLITGKIEKRCREAWLKGPHKDDDEWITWSMMAATCVSHPGITPVAFQKLRDKVGELAMAPVVTAFIDAYKGGGVGAPFSPLLLPDQPTETSSPT